MVLSNRNGVEHVVRIARTGHRMGLENALTGTPSAYELQRTLTEASVVLVPMATLCQLDRCLGTFARRLMNLLADDVADLYEELEGLQNRSTIEQRLARLPGIAARGGCGGRASTQRIQHLASVHEIPPSALAPVNRIFPCPAQSRSGGHDRPRGRRIRITDRHAFARLLCPTCQQAVTRNDVPRPKSRSILRDGMMRRYTRSYIGCARPKRKKPAEAGFAESGAQEGTRTPRR